MSVASGAPPADIAPPPTRDEASPACEASRLWKYADLSYKEPAAAAQAMADDESFPGAEVLGRFASTGDFGVTVPTYVVRDETSCNILISVRGTAGTDDSLADLNVMGGRNDGLLAALAPGLAHRGFANVMLGIGNYEGLLSHRVEGKTLLETVHAAVNACESPRGARILVTGHWLGGAVAALIHFVLLDSTLYDTWLVTFGSPRPISTGAVPAYRSAQQRVRW